MLSAAIRDVPYAYKGKKTVMKAVRGQFCNNRKCREVIMELGESVRTSKEMIEFNKKVNAELTPIALLANVRERLKLTQRQAAKVFGGGANAFSRYESGKTKPPVALVKLLRVLDKHPDLFAEVAEPNGRATQSRASRPAASKRKRRMSARSALA